MRNKFVDEKQENIIIFECPKCGKRYWGLKHLKIICEECNVRCVETKEETK